jgi:hypothetical protein
MEQKSKFDKQTLNKITNKFAIPSIFITEFCAEKVGDVSTPESKQQIVVMAGNADKHLKRSAYILSAECSNEPNSEDVYRIFLGDRVICRYVLNTPAQTLQNQLVALCSDNKKPELEYVLKMMNPEFDLGAYMMSHEPWN